MALPVTKGAWLVNDPEDVPMMLQKAFDLATEGRPGPVLLDIPMDVQRCDIDVPSPLLNVQNPSSTNGASSNGAHGDASSTKEADAETVDAAFYDELFAALQKAEKTSVVGGRRRQSARVVPLVRELIAKLGISGCVFADAVDALPFDDPMRGGWHGSYGNRWANMAIARADLLFVLGSRLDVRQTGADVERSRAGARFSMSMSIQAK
jgi:acetolactate synthase-1/2/3 large subunit